VAEPGTEASAGATGGDVCRWAMLYEPERLISAKSFDFERSARSCLEVAMHVAGAEAGLLATFDRGQELVVEVSAGVDELPERGVPVNVSQLSKGERLKLPNPLSAEPKLPPDLGEGV